MFPVHRPFKYTQCVSYCKKNTHKYYLLYYIAIRESRVKYFKISMDMPL